MYTCHLFSIVLIYSDLSLRHLPKIGTNFPDNSIVIFDLTRQILDPCKMVEAVIVWILQYTFILFLLSYGELQRKYLSIYLSIFDAVYIDRYRVQTFKFRNVFYCQRKLNVREIQHCCIMQIWIIPTPHFFLQGIEQSPITRSIILGFYIDYSPLQHNFLRELDGIPLMEFSLFTLTVKLRIRDSAHPLLCSWNSSSDDNVPIELLAQIGAL